MTPNTITQWLKQPTTAVDAAAVEQLVRTYPYFIPGRYMQAASMQEGIGYQPYQLAHLRLYAGNWLLLQELLARATQQQTDAPPEATNDLPGGQFTTLPAHETPAAAPATTVPASTAGPAAIEPGSSIASIETNTEDLPMKQTSGQEETSGELIQPVFTDDYFRHEGIVVPDEIPTEMESHPAQAMSEDAIAEDLRNKDPRSLMVMMSFSEWLMFYRTRNLKDKEEEEERKAMKTMWQKEKLAAALEEENEEIPENVFEMAVSSLDKDEALVSESLAEILTKQGKIEKAIEMYRKLSLRNPQKSTYFAQQISILQKKTEL